MPFYITAHSQNNKKVTELRKNLPIVKKVKGQKCTKYSNKNIILTQRKRPEKTSNDDKYRIIRIIELRNANISALCAALDRVLLPSCR